MTGLRMGWMCPICQQSGKRTREHVVGRWLADGVRLSTVVTVGSGQLQGVPAGLRVRMRVRMS
jgi:hypothetical protein